jgi:hypothetical protein
LRNGLKVGKWRWAWDRWGNLQEDPFNLTAMAKASRSPGLIQRYREELQVGHCARRTVNTYRRAFATMGSKNLNKVYDTRNCP